ncbi:MAG: hypothetical protein NVSMB31_00430 [Vulcanimicrobiaceae bacterium]
MSNKRETGVLQIDALLRQATGLIWQNLPEEKRSPDELESAVLRLALRITQNFAEDLTAFRPGPQETGQHSNTGKPWALQADDELRALFETGNSIEDLALYFRRTPNAIRARLVKLGLLDASTFQPRFAA